MQAPSDISSGDVSGYILLTKKIRHISSTHQEGARTTIPLHHRWSISTSASASTSTDSITPRTPTDIDAAVFGSGYQFLSVHTDVSSDIDLHTASLSNRGFPRQPSCNVSDSKEHKPYKRYHEHPPVRSSGPNGGPTVPSYTQILPIRTKHIKLKQHSSPVTQKVMPTVEHDDDSESKSTSSHNQSRTPDWSLVVDRALQQHRRVCPKCHDVDVGVLPKLYGSHAVPSTLSTNQLSPSTIALPLRHQELGTRSTPSPAIFSNQTSNAADTKSQSSKQKGKQPEKPPDNDSDADREDDNRENGRSRNSDALSGDSSKLKLRCPFVMSPSYRNCHLKECSNCLVANLRDLDKLTQHFRRTHGYCYRCGSHFEDDDLFKSHKSKQHQCSGCHEVFLNAQALGQHKQQQKCTSRDRRTMAERYETIWNQIVYEEPCPKDYRVDHISEYWKLFQTAGLLQKLKQDCKDGILLQLAAVLKVDNGLSDTNKQDLMELVRQCIKSESAAHVQENDSAGLIEPFEEDKSSSQHVDEPGPSRRRDMSQTTTSQDDISNTLSHRTLDDTPRDQSYSYQSQAPANGVYGQDMATPGTKLTCTLPSRDFVDGPRRSPAMRSYGQDLSPRIVTLPPTPANLQSHVLKHDDSALSCIGQGTYYSYDSSQLFTDSLNQPACMQDQDQIPRTCNQEPNTSAPFPISSKDIASFNAEVSDDWSSLPADPQNDPWINQFATSDQLLLCRQQQRQHQRQQNLQLQSERPNKRTRHDPNQ